MAVTRPDAAQDFPRISAETRRLQARAHALIPGGGHTYAKGDDQYPVTAPPFIARGRGCHVWDADGNEYIEYGMGLRAVALGHAFPPVVAAVRRELGNGTNFVRPSPLEVACAERFLDCVRGAEMVKFCKNGSDATTAAVKLARAATGRDLVALCSDQPFFSTDDWFIGTTEMPAGIPEAIRRLSVGFRYNDLPGLEALLEEHRGRIACVILEAETTVPPAPGYHDGLRRLCDEHGVLLVLDENITGFRWEVGGAQQVHGIRPDLSCFGKAVANGFALSALAGRRDLMERGGLTTSEERVFLLSTTHGAETHALAAAIATMDTYRREPVIETLYRQGERLRRGVDQVVAAHGLEGIVAVLGRHCNMVYATRDAERKPSQVFRTVFMQQLIRHGVIGPSFVISYSHSDEDVDRTIEAVDAALVVYRRALDEGPERHLEGRPVRPVSRPRN